LNFISESFVLDVVHRLSQQSLSSLSGWITGKPEVTPEDRDSRHYFRIADDSPKTSVKALG
jgi:hypothetical protein